MTLLEQVARAICWKRGNDPDVSLGGDKQNFLWMEYEDEAHAALQTVAQWLREPSGQLHLELDRKVRDGTIPANRVDDALHALADALEKEMG